MNKFTKGDTVIIQDGSEQKNATVVETGIDDKNRVRVRPVGYPMDISITLDTNAPMFIVQW